MLGLQFGSEVQLPSLWLDLCTYRAQASRLCQDDVLM